MLPTCILRQTAKVNNKEIGMGLDKNYSPKSRDSYHSLEFRITIVQGSPLHDVVNLNLLRADV
jgi:hypothetical protein